MQTGAWVAHELFPVTKHFRTAVSKLLLMSEEMPSLHARSCALTMVRKVL